jgi:hypothetical protein
LPPPVRIRRNGPDAVTCTYTSLPEMSDSGGHCDTSPQNRYPPYTFPLEEVSLTEIRNFTFRFKYG